MVGEKEVRQRGGYGREGIRGGMAGLASGCANRFACDRGNRNGREQGGRAARRGHVGTGRGKQVTHDGVALWLVTGGKREREGWQMGRDGR